MRNYLITKTHKDKPNPNAKANHGKQLIYIAFHKPYGVLSQFTSEEGKQTLKDYLKVQKDVYPVGRLDTDSEGLLLLTNDTSVNNRLLDPKYEHERVYLAFVEGIPAQEELAKFRNGVVIGDYTTKPAKIEIASEPSWLSERVPPPRVYETKLYSWIKVILTEGKNRQVRKMAAAIGHPVLRLIRVRILNIKLNQLKPGEKRDLTKEEVTLLRKSLSLQIR